MTKKEITKDLETNETKLLSPTMDFVFQVLFGEVGSEEITKDFLEAILKEKITEINLSRNPILRREKIEGKMGILDVIVEINKKETCNIEMQVGEREDIVQRLLYYWGKMYTKNINKGEQYKELKRTIVIMIAGFELKELKEQGYYTRWKLIETENRKQILTDDIEIDIIELPKIHNRNIEKEDSLLEWLYFLENPDSEGVKRIVEKNEGVKKAKEKLEEISNDEIMQRLADWKEAAERDEMSVRSMAMRRGLEEGREKGLKEGIKEGIKEGRREGKKEGKEEGKKEAIYEMAKKMKERNIDIKLIMELTKLNKEEIEKI